jgi:hypothetical protein
MELRSLGVSTHASYLFTPLWIPEVEKVKISTDNCHMLRFPRDLFNETALIIKK